MAKKFRTKWPSMASVTPRAPPPSKTDGASTLESETKRFSFALKMYLGAHVGADHKRRESYRSSLTVALLCENPGLTHQKAVVGVLRYLLQTMNWRVMYDGLGFGPTMDAYVDCELAVYLDTTSCLAYTTTMLMQANDATPS